MAATYADALRCFTNPPEKFDFSLLNLPVLMMTAFHYDKDHIIKRSRMEGLEGVIFKKPVDPDRLRHAIAESVGKA